MAEDSAFYQMGVMVGQSINGKVATADLASADGDEDKGAALVGYIPEGDGAVPTTVFSILRERVSVERNGADPNGIIPANTAFNRAAAVVLANGGGDLYVGPGDFLLLDWAIPAGVRLVGAGRGRTRLKKNGGGAGTYVIKSSGTVQTGSALTANRGFGNFSVTVANAALFTVGSYALIRENTYVLGSAGRKQQILRVVAVNTGTGLVSFAQPLYESYTTGASATLHPLNALTDSGIFGLSVEGVNANVSGGCIHIGHSIGFSVDDVHARYFSDVPGFKFSTTYDSHIYNSSAVDGINVTAGGYGYCLVFDESCDLSSARNSYFENGRETTFTNRTINCTFSGNKVIGMQDSGFNTHGSMVRLCTASDNDIIGVRNGPGLAIGYDTHTGADSDIKFSGNRITSAGSHGISISSPAGKVSNRLSIENNEIVNCGLVNANSYGVFVGRSVEVSLKGNRIDGGLIAGHKVGIYFFSAVRASSTNDRAAYSSGIGFRYDDCTDLRIDNPTTYGNVAQNFYGTGSNVRVIVNGKQADNASEVVAAGTALVGSVQSGRHVLTFSGEASKTEQVTFPSNFPLGTIPNVVATPENTLGNWRSPVVLNRTASGYQLTVADQGGVARTGSLPVNWIAVG